MTPCELRILPEFERVATGERRATFVARIEPPALTPERPPARVVLALDTSGSMAYGRLDHALACAMAVVRALGTRDTFACVSFNAATSLLAQPLAMTAAGKEVALAGLRRRRPT